MITLLFLILLIIPHQTIDGLLDFGKWTHSVAGVFSLCLAGCYYMDAYEHNKGVPEADTKRRELLQAGRRASSCKNYLIWYKNKKGGWPSVGGDDFIDVELQTPDYLNKNITQDNQLDNVFQNIGAADFNALSRKIVDIAESEAEFHWKKQFFFASLGCVFFGLQYLEIKKPHLTRWLRIELF